MENKVIKGINVITDNWTLKVVHDYLSGAIDPSEKRKIVLASHNSAYESFVPLAIFQIDCLVNLIEQIIFSDSIFLREEWIPLWANKSTPLDLLLKEEGFITPINIKNCDIEKEQKIFYNELVRKCGIEDIYETGVVNYKRQNFEKKEHLIWENKSDIELFSQIVNGSVEYLSLASKLGLTYLPHSARNAYLRSTLWDTRNIHGYKKVNQIINQKRTKVSELCDHDSRLIETNLLFPSSSMLCFAESTDNLSPIEIAIQIRNSKEIRTLRKMFFQLTVAVGNLRIENESLKIINNIYNEIEDKLNKAENKLFKGSIIKSVSKLLNLDYFFFEKFGVSGLIGHPKNISNSGILSKLILTGKEQMNQIITEKLKIKEPNIINHLSSWYKGDFLSVNLEKTKLKVYNNIKTTNMEKNMEKIFIVHGHNSAIQQTVARVVEKLGLNPIILHEQPNEGKTIIEKFEKYSDVGFAIILLTDDDEGKAKSETGFKKRARQNVILELGYFIGKLGRSKVLPLYSEGVELPSDIYGLLYTSLDSAEKWKFSIAKELKEVGYDVDANKLL